MTGPWTGVSRPALETIAKALAAGKLTGPFTPGVLGRHVSNVDLSRLSGELDRLHATGMATRQIAEVVRAVAFERKHKEAAADRVELVWTGPETRGSQSRDTSVVARELFATASRTILISTYAVYLGRDVFEPLARRMEERTDLRVLLFLNVPHPPGTAFDPDVVARDYFREFLKKNWPGPREPELYYDRRSLANKGEDRGVIHAKVIVVDGHTALVTSANFTEAAHARNIEAGALVRDPAFATSLEQQFTSLVASGALVRVHV